MKAKEIEKRLMAWAARCEAVDKVYEDMRSLVGINIEGPLATQLFGALEDYTAALGEIVGDDAEWMAWFRNECDMGRAPMGVKFPGGKEFKVRTVRDLARTIEREGAA